MLNPQRAITDGQNDHEHEHYHDDDHHQEDDEPIRDIHALTPPQPPPVNRGRRREAWETSSHRSSSMSTTSEGSAIETNESDHVMNNINGTSNTAHLARIGEDEIPEETNPLAIVPDHNPLDLGPGSRRVGSSVGQSDHVSSVQRVKKEEVESKISAWQNAKIAKINNKFKREDAVINGWEGEQVQKATSWMKKVERKLEEKRARALEKMQNNVAKAHRKAEERRASSEAKRGTKVARVLEVANLMRAVGRAPAKRSFF
ncbi:hypothetical protein AB3S75_045439 [Citrus x aurantiifolia]